MAGRGGSGTGLPVLPEVLGGAAGLSNSDFPARRPEEIQFRVVRLVKPPRYTIQVRKEQGSGSVGH